MILKRRVDVALVIITALFVSCNKGSDTTPPVNNESFKFISVRADDRSSSSDFKDVPISSVFRLSFSAPVNKVTAGNSIILKKSDGTTIPVTLNYEKGDSVIALAAQPSLNYLTRYSLYIFGQLQSAKNKALGKDYQFNLFTSLDSTDKFPAKTDDELLDMVQKQTLKYFFDFAHPVSGLARERNTSDNIVTTGGSGFGIMALIAGVSRNFITRADGLNQITKITDFLTNNVTTFHGAFPHWLDGATGATIPFSPDDNGADLVETSYLMEGLLCARQYFNGADASEADLRTKINAIWNKVEWDWFRQNNQDVLYWHWSADKDWIMNVPVSGWNEALITYIMAASSATHTIDATVYTNGWAQNGGMKNGSFFYNYVLPLGPALGGPLFFEHYSFMGINPNGLSDQYANYQTQTTNHTLINYKYCVTNPKGYFGYSDACWGLTASDDPSGYDAHEPNNDNGVITPSAALSSFPYTPAESMKALKFFYYKLGDKIWKEYGFVDAFSLNNPWFADSFLAIDQGPIIVMIENYRSGLMWNLFTGSPEVKAGLVKLGFSAPYL